MTVPGTIIQVFQEVVSKDTEDVKRTRTELLLRRDMPWAAFMQLDTTGEETSEPEEVTAGKN